MLLQLHRGPPDCMHLVAQSLTPYPSQVPLKLLNCWESIAEENKDAIRPYVNALLPHVVGS